MANFRLIWSHGLDVVPLFSSPAFGFRVYQILLSDSFFRFPPLPAFTRPPSPSHPPRPRSHFGPFRPTPSADSARFFFRPLQASLWQRRLFRNSLSKFWFLKKKFPAKVVARSHRRRRRRRRQRDVGDRSLGMRLRTIWSQIVTGKWPRTNSIKI